MIVEQQRPRRILDFGCGMGTFLESIRGSGIEKYGVEPSESAAQLARRRGIAVLSEEQLADPRFEHTFDVITAIDVVEHATDIGGLRNHFARLLKPGGLLIVLTGNLRSRAAEIVGRYWYYMHYAEHLNFFSDRSIRTWLEPGFESAQVTFMSHHPLSYREAAQFIKAWVAFPFKWTLRALSTNGNGANLGLPVRNDHMIVCAIRRGDSSNGAKHCGGNGCSAKP
jgi:2-polyprenyl-3-methyl-5-hydroxy-6-metoxy-1,4-benzoquinol methylase